MARLLVVAVGPVRSLRRAASVAHALVEGALAVGRALRQGAVLV